MTEDPNNNSAAHTYVDDELVCLDWRHGPSTPSITVVVMTARKEDEWLLF